MWKCLPISGRYIFLDTLEAKLNVHVLYQQTDTSDKTCSPLCDIVLLIISDYFIIFILGTNLMSENTIIDLPTGVVTFYMDIHEPRTPGMYS